MNFTVKYFKMTLTHGIRIKIKNIIRDILRFF